VLSPLAHAQTPDTPPEQEKPPTYEEHVVVTASRVEQDLVNAPASISVISSETIQNSPSAGVGDLLRTVPGVNVTQLSARDINLTSRSATSTLATSQLALVDGRSVYLDFFGMVMWDLVSANPSDIRQIEVIRGPASAVWGANAMSGVVNIITKTPRELAAEGKGTLAIGFGAFDRDVKGARQDENAGLFFSMHGAYAEAVNDRWSYKLSAGYLTQDPFARPAGNIPNAFQTPYPPFTNSGTTQPKFDARVDYDLSQGGVLSFSGGVAGTDGIIYTGIGPFDVIRGSKLGYFSSRYARGARSVSFFTNLLDGHAGNLLANAPSGAPLRLDFNTGTFDIGATDSHAFGSRHLLSYGGNYRHNTFDFSIAPTGGDRNEGGGYLQDEIFFNQHLRWIVGARLDKFSSIEDAVFSPRTTLLIKPSLPHTFRLSYNRAFRAPSYVNNNLDVVLNTDLNLGLLNPALAGVIYSFPVRAIGNADLKQETMTAYEVGYTGTIRNRMSVTGAVYWNRTDEAILFTQTARYGALNPPPRWPLPAVVLEAAAAAGSPLPSEFSYRNLGSVDDKGIELGLDAALNQAVNVFTNYSYQWTPETEGFPLSEVNLPPNRRFNAGFNFAHRALSGNMTVSYTDEAFWQDVLDVRYHGTTEPYTLINGAIGVRWMRNRLLTSLKVTNLTNKDIQQHIFGDVIKRQVSGEVRLSF
jgi:iron complex outermembrane receptor protein